MPATLMEICGEIDTHITPEVRGFRYDLPPPRRLRSPADMTLRIIRYYQAQGWQVVYHASQNCLTFYRKDKPNVRSQSAGRPQGGRQARARPAHSR